MGILNQVTVVMHPGIEAIMHPYLQALQDRILVYDGAMGTSIQPLDLTLEDYGGQMGCNEMLVFTRPDVITRIHEDYLEAGADVLETDTFGGSRLKLGEYGMPEKVYEQNFTAARLAREAADRFSTPGRPRFVAGSIGPTGLLPSSSDPTLGNVTFEELADLFEEQARPLVEGGCDVLLIETSQDILEVKAAITGLERYFSKAGRRVPIQAQVTLDVTGRMLLGTDIGAAVAILEALPIDVIGLNCSTGPEHMRGPVQLLFERATKPISLIPNAGLPLNVDGKAVYPLEPVPMAETLREYVQKYGVNLVGGCCGTTPDHIRALSAAVADLKPLPRPGAGAPHVASAMRSVSLWQEPRPLLVGERVNAQGSRKLKQMLLADDYDGVLEIAREQVENGAHVLDVCVALTERADEVEQMRKVVKTLAQGVEAPLMIDSTEPAVILEALRTFPGRAIVNSVHLENGRARIDAILPHALEHGAAVVALTIDEVGMAKTAERKLEVARRIHDLVVGEYGLKPEALIFDALTFTLATGDPEFAPSALDTLEGIRRIKAELPGVLTTLGVSNVSFGLQPHARAVVNGVFLHHAVEAGLDLAIVNPAHVMPLAEIPPEALRLAENLVLNRSPEALQELIVYFEANQAAAGSTSVAEDPTAGMTSEQRIHWQILHRRKEGIEALIDDALSRQDPVTVLNTVLLPAMKDVGDRFGAGELILPFVLQSAEVMKKAVKHLEQFLDRTEGVTKGTVVLATVYGDVHDIGKNLVQTILSNNGYTVHDLGKQVPVQTILDRARELKADAIGLSALLVSTSKQMPLCVQEAHRQGVHVPILIGGAAINRSFGRRIGLLDDGTPYGPGVFYANDAFEGLSTLERLNDPAEREGFLADIHRQALAEKERQARLTQAAPAVVAARSATRLDVPVPQAPFWGHRVLADVPLDRVFECLDFKSLYRLSWGGKSTTGEAWERLLKEEFEPRLARMRAEVLREGWLEPRGVYGFYPCQADGDTLVVFDSPEGTKVRARFTFPRQPDGDRLCLADYFQPLGGDRMDVLALQAVTVGPRSTERMERLQAAGDYSEAYYVHGLAVEAAEALAELLHRHVRREWGLPAGQGKRYSWGYPAIPDLEDHRILFDLLPIEATTGMTLTESCQLVPEQSTVAMIIHHPEARYYAIRAIGASA